MRSMGLFHQGIYRNDACGRGCNLNEEVSAVITGEGELNLDRAPRRAGIRTWIHFS